MMQIMNRFCETKKCPLCLFLFLELIFSTLSNTL